MIICVKNVPNALPESAVRDLFGRFGTVKSIAKSMGKAYVDMPHKEEAMCAIEFLNGAQHWGATIEVNKRKLPRSNWLWQSPQLGLIRLL